MNREEIEGCRVVHEFSVMWPAWECDELGWVTEDGRAWMTSHGRLYEAGPGDLLARMEVALRSVDGIRQALSLLGGAPFVPLGDFRVDVVFENADDEVLVRAGHADAVRRVEVEAFVVVDRSPATPLYLPEALVAELGLRDVDRRWEPGRFAGPVLTRIGGRRTIGDCCVLGEGDVALLGTTVWGALDLVPDLVSRELRPGRGLRA